ncbi:hypothetical protein AB5J72_07780 [Streptomyces sp. CG1]|uniref:hypothetical protein n=1 Tax=Streptomyces sp. CG1 TaxID=1287523 RepID=UPI0034E1FC17
MVSATYFKDPADPANQFNASDWAAASGLHQAMDAMKCPTREGLRDAVHNLKDVKVGLPLPGVTMSTDRLTSSAGRTPSRGGPVDAPPPGDRSRPAAPTGPTCSHGGQPPVHHQTVRDQIWHRHFQRALAVVREGTVPAPEGLGEADVARDRVARGVPLGDGLRAFHWR